MEWTLDKIDEDKTIVHIVNNKFNDNPDEILFRFAKVLANLKALPENNSRLNLTVNRIPHRLIN